jgi:hypothetical protein
VCSAYTDSGWEWLTMVDTNTGTMSLQEVEQGHHQRLPNVRKKELDMCIMDSEEKKVSRRGIMH